MNWQKWKSEINERVDLTILIKIILVMLIVYLFLQTEKVWKGILVAGIQIVTPFFIGFVIAYLFYPIVRKMEKRKISKKVVIPILFLLLIGAVTAIVFAIAPILYERTGQLINSFLNSANYLISIYEGALKTEPSVWASAIIEQIEGALGEVRTIVPTLSAMVPEIISNVLNFLTNAIFTIIISIYMLIDYQRVTGFIDRIASDINPDCLLIFKKIDERIGAYLKSLCIIMIIKFVEYSILYMIVGHKAWLIIALLMSIGLIVPYFGAMLAHGIGILTALTLPTHSLIILLVGIVLLSTMDSYVIAPLVHMRGNRIHPLWTLFSVVGCGMLLGGWGIILAVPIYMIGRIIFQYFQEKIAL
ncbi:MAG: AI-2E family transporter [Anaerorhabdus sp.]